MERDVLICTDHSSLDIVENLSALLPSNDEEQESATEAFTKITTVDRKALGTDVSKESNNDNDMISLLMSTSRKDEEHVRCIFQRTVDHVNSVDGSGVTPLMLASKLGNVNVVKILLWAGASVNTVDHYGQSALLNTIQFNGQIKCDGKCTMFDIPVKGGRGCFSSRMKILKDLLMHGADPNIRDKRLDKSALILLAGAPLFPPCRCCGRNMCYGIKLLQESCHLLLRHGANVNIKDPFGMTALMHAVKKRFTAVCEPLIEFGADINLQDNLGRSALMLGVSHLEICTLLLQQGADVHLRSANGLTALNMVSYSDSPELCKVLIAFGADICERGRDGKSFLMNLVQTGFSKDLAYLLDLDVDANKINIKSRCRKTLLMGVIEADCQEWFEDLVSRGVDVDAQDYDGKTALTYAVEKDSRTWCRLLTSLTSDINMSDKQGKTNLMCAVESNSQIWAFHLIDQGIDVNRQDHSGKTALMYAIQTFQQEDDASYWADLLLGARSNVNIQDGTGKTALMYAIAFGVQHWMHSLIRSGNVDFGIRDCEGRTACMYSILFFPYLGLNLLYAESRVLNIGDKDGRTVLMYAALYNSIIFKKLIHMESVDINVCDREGRRAVDYALCVEQTGKPTQNYVSLNTLFQDLYLILTTNRHASGNFHRLHKNIDRVSSHDGRCLLVPKYRSVFHEMTFWRENHTLDRSKPTSSLQSFLQRGSKGMVQLCVYNGVVLENNNCSSIFLALSLGYSDIVKYFLATWYLSIDDMKDMLAAVREIKYRDISGKNSRGNDRRHTSRRRFGGSRLPRRTSVPVNLNSSTIAERLDEEEVDLLMEATSQPWPLVTLAFITVSSAIGGGPDRQERISHLPLPVPLKNMLNFQREVTSCPVEDWDDIPLCFNAVEYDNVDKRRPLLYHWPIGNAWKSNQS